MSMIEEYLVRDIPQLKAKPIVKWAGGKQQLWSEIARHFPDNYGKYIEPFMGGGAIFFGLLPKNAVLSDANPELINLYTVVRDKVDELINELQSYEHSKDFYYTVRGIDPQSLTDIQRAARILYLNKTCFNGLYRVNKNGQFNVPIGNQRNPRFCDSEGLRTASDALNGKIILCKDYLDVLNEYAEPGDLIYIDPPYLPISQYSDFKRYTKEFFYEEDHIALSEEVKRLYALGCTVVLSNSNNPLVYELYSDYKLEIHRTKRYINSNASKRDGIDVIIVAEPKRKSFKVVKPDEPKSQIDFFPGTRYMGSKYNLINDIWDIAGQFKFDSVLDAFSGSGVVSYMFKTHYKKVISNDFMTFAATITKALIENNTITLAEGDIDLLLVPGEGRGFITDTFRDLYFCEEDNIFLDDARTQIDKLNNQYKKALALASLCRACLKKRPRGIFTYVGDRYDDGRDDLRKSIKQHFLESIELYNNAVFNNGQRNISMNKDTMQLHTDVDFVYIDPPYYSPLSDNEYTRRYHFVEGLARYWDGIEIQWNTKTRKFKKYPTPFGTKTSAYDAFDKLYKRFRESIIMVSYSSNAYPTMDEMIELLSKYKSKVEVYKIDHKYSIGNQSVDLENNKVQEFIFVGY